MGLVIPAAQKEKVMKDLVPSPQNYILDQYQKRKKSGRASGSGGKSDNKKSPKRKSVRKKSESPKGKSESSDISEDSEE